ncbi:MAG: ParM/StbA family protein [Clostridia bacterium]|nr:ParM/StbA family protein [Clostridia bacterium]
MDIIIPVACDAGNDSIKVIVNEKVTYISNLVKRADTARMVFGKGDIGKPEDYLDVTIDSPALKGSYYISELAGSLGGGMESLGGLKCENDLLLAAMLTSIAFSLKDIGQDSPLEIALGTGLPVHEFFSQNSSGQYDYQNVIKFKKRLQGEHIIRFNSNLFSKKEIVFNLSKENILVLPEGYAALLALLYKSDGSSAYPEYTAKGINSFALDIGGGSADVSAVREGNFMQQAMFGIPIGVNEAHDMLCQRITARTGLQGFTRHNLKQVLFERDFNGLLRTSKEEFDLNEEKIPFYEKLAEKLLYQFKRQLNVNNLSTSMIHVLFLIGGGGSEIGDYIIKHLKDEIPKIIKVENSRSKNVEGYYSSIKSLLQN